jgi:hypothetical protein
MPISAAGSFTWHMVMMIGFVGGVLDWLRLLGEENRRCSLRKPCRPPGEASGEDNGLRKPASSRLACAVRRGLQPKTKKQDAAASDTDDHAGAKSTERAPTDNADLHPRAVVTPIQVRQEGGRGEYTVAMAIRRQRSGEL